jgi:hypothetical protein
MDGLGRIAQKLFPELPRLEPRQDPKPAGQGFQVEAASLEISLKLNYVQLTKTGDANAPADTAQDLLEKVRQWVRDLFEQNGLEWQELSPEEAQAKIAEGGDQAPDAVAKRILDFVKGFADGSPERAQLLRDAVEQGFEEAEGVWGGKLPEISHKTMDLVRKGLDELFGAAPTEQTEKPEAKQPKVDLAA